MAVLAFCLLLVKRNELLLVSNITQLGNVLVSDRIYYVIHYASQQLERCPMSKRYQPLFADESREKCPYIGCGGALFEDERTYHCRGCNTFFYLEEKTLEESYDDE